MEMEKITGVPYASTVFFPSFNVSGFISTITTPRAPSLAKETAIAFPSPRAPPVTKATPGATGPDLLNPFGQRGPTWSRLGRFSPYYPVYYECSLLDLFLPSGDDQFFMVPACR